MGGVAHLGRRVRVPVATHFLEIHTVVDAHARGDVEVFERREGGLYRNLMAYAVVPVFHQVLFKELVLTGSEGVLELTAVAQTNFLIPALTANSLFALER